MIHNHVLDILRGRISPQDIIISDKLDRRTWARMIRKAEVFDFGELPLEDSGKRSRIDGSPIWSVPKLTDEELQFFEEGLIPLPADPSWFEFTLSGHGSAYLVWGTAPKISSMRFDLDANDGKITGGVAVGVVVKARPGYQVEMDYAQAQKSMMKFHNTNPAEAEAEASAIPLLRYLLLMLNSRSTEREKVVQPPVAGILAKLPGNRHPLPDHTIVRIIPKGVMKELTKNNEGKSHASPRLHWRRSHLREYKAPSGAVYHRVVIPRTLVGLASEETITHTYKVKL